MVGQRHELPLATFGKAPGASAYTTLTSHPDFDRPAIAAALQKVCTSFEWKPDNNGEGRHPPCFAILQVEGGTLVARYTDAGRDQAGRPHTLRVDCVLADPQTAPHLCAPSSWRRLGAETASLVRSGHSPRVADPTTLSIIGDPETFTAAQDCRQHPG